MARLKSIEWKATVRNEVSVCVKDKEFVCRGKDLDDIFEMQ